MIPLQVGVPGGPELLIILLIAILLFGVPVVLVASGFYLYRRSQSHESTNDEVESLRREVERLHEKVDRLEDDEQ